MSDYAGLSKGKTYELKLLSRVIFNSDFGEEVIHDLDPNLFEELNFKQISVLIQNYYNTYKLLPNIDNIKQVISTTITNETSSELLCKYLDKMTNYRKAVEKGEVNNDYEHIENEFYEFIKTQKMKNDSIELQEALELGDHYKANQIIEKLKENSEYGVKKDYGFDMQDFIKDPENPKYIETDKDLVPFGWDFIDKEVGGMRKGDLIILLSGQGVGKTTLLSDAANNVSSNGENVLHVFFGENTVGEIRQKHTTKYTGFSKEDIKKKPKETGDKIKEFAKKHPNMGRLILKKFESEGFTVPKLRDWILRYQKRFGIKFGLIVVDYMDEFESHKSKDFVGNSWDGPEVYVAKALQSLASELVTPILTAIQSKKESNHKRILDKTDAGGSVAKIKKCQLMITIGRDLNEQQNNLANIAIAKCNYATAGKIWEHCTLNNALMILNEGKLSNNELDDYDEDDIALSRGQAVEPKENNVEVKPKSIITLDKKDIVKNL